MGLACIMSDIVRDDVADGSLIRVRGAGPLRIEWDSVEGHLTGFRRAPESASFLEAIKPYIGQIEEMQHDRLTSVVKNKAS